MLSSILGFLNRHVYKAVFLELGLGVEISDQESSLLILLRDIGHQLDVHFFGEVLHILAQVSDGRRHMHFVLPFVLGPLQFEFEFRTVSWHECINEIDLDLIDINNRRQIA